MDIFRHRLDVCTHAVREAKDTESDSVYDYLHLRQTNAWLMKTVILKVD